MADICCPKCGHVFELKATDYDAIASQVRTAEFEKEVASRMRLFEESMNATKTAEVQAAKLEAVQDLQKQLTSVQQTVSELQAKLAVADSDKKLAVLEAVQQQKEEDADTLKDLQTELDYYKDLKAKMSTKMVGESLEQHCLTQFNQVRAMAFPNAYFEKDNDIRTGSKGDFIFREEQDGVEILSIMFEMKNEMDKTATKHMNEDFFKELDKDRREKHCEYAVLVSLLESDSELYNTGIVDVSYRYPNMYVVRPQFFLTIIGLLRNAALHHMETRRELQRIQNRNLDVTRFENSLLDFKGKIAKNYDLASRQFQTAVDEIDKSIDHLQKVRKNLVSSERNLRLLNDKTADLTIASLTKDNPTMRELFDE